MAVLTNTVTTADVAPAITVDHVERLVSDIEKLQAVLGVSNMIPVQAGSVIKRYKTSATLGAQVAEGELLNLSEIKRTPMDDFAIALKKYRKLTTAEAIQKAGSDVAINATDDRLIKEVQADVKSNFFTMLGAGTGSAPAGTTFQQKLANLWGSVTSYFEDIDATPIFFVNPVDVAEYLGQASISTQTAFGFEYVENFLGLGNAIVSAKVKAGSPAATVQENLNGAYVPANGDLSTAFGLQFDESGLVGMSHNVASDRASIDTLVLSGVQFYPEDEAGIFVNKAGA